jgi:integrase
MNEKRIRLTEAVVESAKYPYSGQVFKRDATDIGLALRLTPGSKTFIYEGAASGRMHRVKLGCWPDLTVAAARRVAKTYRAKISQGQDPFAERQRKRDAERDAVTFGELVKQFIELHAKPHCRSWKRMEVRLDKHFGQWNARRLEDITPAVVAKAHSQIADAHRRPQRQGDTGQVEANRALQLLRLVFNKGKRLKLWSGENPVDGLTFFPEEPDRKVLDPSELERVTAVIEAEPNEYWRTYFKLLLMIGKRKSELLAARWERVNFELGVLVLPKTTTKTAKFDRVVLPAAAIALIEALPSRGESEWLFPSYGASGHLVEPTKAWERIRTAADVEHVTIHGLRGTVGTMMDERGESLATIQRVLAHSRISTTEKYLRPRLEFQREALERQAAVVTGSDQSRSTSS